MSSPVTVLKIFLATHLYALFKEYVAKSAVFLELGVSFQ